MSLDNVDPCGCERERPDDGRPWNDAGLSALDYRVSRHPLAKQRMLERLSTQSFNVKVIKNGVEDVEPGPDVLDALSTREDIDPTIALIDAWAVTCDVLSFYDERIINEGYLRTATERRSVLELAREIGYELNPGASATAYLAFTVDNSPLAPGEATIPKGLAVQHVPQKEELPQTFETSDEVYVKATWNELLPETQTKQVLEVGHAEPLLIDGPLPEVKVGDYLVLQPDASGAEPEVKLVQGTSFDNATGKTTLTISHVGAMPAPAGPAADAGMNMSNAGGSFGSVFGMQYSEQSLQSYSMYSNLSLMELEVAALAHIDLNVYRDVPTVPSPPVGDNPSDFSPGVFGFKYRTANFGHNAPPYASLPASMRTETGAPFPLSYEDNHLANKYDGNAWPGGMHFYLERLFSDLLPGEPLLIQSAGDDPDLWQIQDLAEATVADYTISVKATGLKLVPVSAGAQEVNAGDKKTNPAAPATPTFPDNQTVEATALTKYKLRTTTVFTGAFGLKLSTLPVTDDIPAGATTITLQNEVTGLSVGQYVMLTGELADWPGVERSELLTLKEISHLEGQTTLTFESGLANTYSRSTVKINANVVAATHGETVVTEVLGSGDSSQEFAKYALKKPPLTYVPAATPTGAESTLSVYVNDVLWQPITNWYMLGPKDRAYKVTIDDDGKTWVGFGDGRRGARPPTGTYNIVANYRSGTGSGGAVPAETLTLLKKKPLGIRSVTNKLAAEGGVDPESRDDARSNAPKTVLTMGYVVSSADLENFARAFAGVGKALATEVVIASEPTVLLTLASSSGTPFETTTTTDAFEDAIRQFGEPGVKYKITSYHARNFEVTAKVTMDPAYIADNVKAAVEAALLSAFSFSERCFGQNVTYAEVVAIIQRVEGVVRVDLEPLVVTDIGDDESAKVVGSTIVAQKAGWDAATKSIREPALVTINPFAITIEVSA